MRPILSIPRLAQFGLTLTFLAVPTLALAAEPSVTCSVELTRREAIAASDYAIPNSPWLYWVGIDGASNGPWSALEIKRRILRGDLPADIWIYPLHGNAWGAISQSTDFVPLPGNAVLPPQDLDQDLAQLMSGCWVSDPVSEAAGDETTWIFMLFESGVFLSSRGVLTTTTGKEGFWFSRSSNAPWQISGPARDHFTLSLPDINYFNPVDSFPAQLLDRNQLRLELPGLGAVTFRRM